MNEHKGSHHHSRHSSNHSSEQHTEIQVNVHGEQVHVMDGVPMWMAIGGLAVIIIASHIFLSRQKSSENQYLKMDLLKFLKVKWLFRHPAFPMIAQFVSIVLFLLILVTGFIGNQNQNISTVLTWTWWWVLLIFFILGFGKIFCMICPWEGISSLVTSLSLQSRIKKIGFEIKWPKVLKNVYPALILFIILTWFELGYDITRSPSMTAMMAATMLFLAVFSAIVFEKRAFCRYACLVGRISGIYAMFSPVELRAVSNDVCASCKGKECFTGTEKDTSCPTGLFPSKLTENTYCTFCTECIRSCPHDNLTINVRPPATDLKNKTSFKWDESVLIIVLLALTSFHGVTMTPYWWSLVDMLRVETGFGKTPVFSVLMLIMLIVPVFVFWLSACISRRLVNDDQFNAGYFFRAFSYPLIPVALFYHLAHNGMHFFMEAQTLLPLLSDPFGWGWDIFGTAKKSYEPLLSMNSIWIIQVALIVIGHIYGVTIADRVAKKFLERSNILKALIPMIVTMICYSGFSIWLVAQPMEMRTGM